MSAEPVVHIVDDDEGIRRSVRALVRSMGLNPVMWSCAEEFLEAVDPSRPGCVVTDMRMPGMSGIELQETLKTEHIGLPVIIITAFAETPVTVRAVKQGAVTVLEKPCRDYELYNAIRDALAQDAVNRAAHARQHNFQTRLTSLSPPEHEVLELILEGAANKNIARKLDVSVRTVENRRQKIFEKTGTQSLAELIRCCVQTDRSNH